MWLRDMPLGLVGGGGPGDPDIGKNSRQRAIERQRRWEIEAEALWKRYSKEPLFFAGLGLYWGEGGKTRKVLVMANSDPDLIRCWIKWCLRYLPKDLKQTVRVVAHNDVDGVRVRKFWANVTKWPVAAHVTRIDTRKKDRRPTRLARNGTVSVKPGRGSAECFVKMMYWLNKLKLYRP